MSATLLAPDNVTRVDARGNEIEIQLGRLDDNARHYFTNGQCHAMALEIARLTGMRLAIIGAVRRKDGSRLARLWRIITKLDRVDFHVVCQTADGRYLDAKGLHTSDYVHLAYTNTLRQDGRECDYTVTIDHDCSPESVSTYTARKGWLERDTQLAQLFAPLVLADMGFIVEAA
jgi:hypothetical protein